MKQTADTCKCSICMKIEREKWEEIAKCTCECHKDGETHHEVLCCHYPNVLTENVNVSSFNCPNCGQPFYLSPIGKDGLYCELCQPEL